MRLYRDFFGGGGKGPKQGDVKVINLRARQNSDIVYSA